MDDGNSGLGYFVTGLIVAGFAVFAYLRYRKSRSGKSGSAVLGSAEKRKKFLGIF